MIAAVLLGACLWAAPASGQSWLESLLPDSTIAPRKEFKYRAAAPLLFYLPETKIGAGLVGFNYFKTSPTDTLSRISLVRLLLLYTQTRQITANLSTGLYLSRNRLWLNGGLAYFRLPFLFYGIGNSTTKAQEEEFTMQYPRVRLNSMWRVWPNVYTGLGFVYEQNRIVKYRDGGEIASGRLTGSRGGQLAGAGLLFTYDSRDHNLSPSRGGYADLNLFGFGKAIGSDFRYRQLELDLRRYIPFRRESVLAAQVVLTDIRGEAPFRRLAMLGGSSTMRGYYPGRYRDKTLVAAQLEYRFPVYRIIGAVAFAGAGDVGPSAHHLDLFEYKPTYGGGIRLNLDKKNKLTLRLDAAFGYQTHAYYFSIGEAF